MFPYMRKTYLCKIQRIQMLIYTTLSPSDLPVVMEIMEILLLNWQFHRLQISISYVQWQIWSRLKDHKN